MINVCFHGVGEPARELEPGEDRYWVGVDTFRAVLDEIATWPDVRISFDDGNASDVVHGLPALQERGLTATFFVLARRLGLPGSLGADDVRALRRAGMTIGSHGMDHRPWRALPPEARERELVTARQRIAEAAGAPVTEAACPLGRYDRRLLADLRSLGYTRVHTSDRRRARPDAWLQPRFSVRRGDTAGSLRSDLLARPGPVRGARLVATGWAKRLR
ncbi:MAG: polysaccharide deacetylase family protein [Kineosporiaceae bacterium]